MAAAKAPDQLAPILICVGVVLATDATRRFVKALHRKLNHDTDHDIRRRVSPPFAIRAARISDPRRGAMAQSARSAAAEGRELQRCDCPYALAKKNDGAPGSDGVDAGIEPCKLRFQAVAILGCHGQQMSRESVAVDRQKGRLDGDTVPVDAEAVKELATGLQGDLLVPGMPEL